MTARVDDLPISEALSLVHHDIHCNVKKAPAKTANKREADDTDLEIR